MGLLTELLLLPLAPVRGLTWVARQVHDEAERQRRSPERLREELVKLDEAVSRGELSGEEAALREEAILLELIDSEQEDSHG